MTHRIRPCIAAAAVAGSIACSSASAQMASPAPLGSDSATTVDVLRAVLSYRVYSMSDSTPVSACKLLATKRTTSSELAAEFPARLGMLVDSRFSGCAPRQPGAGTTRDVFAVESITSADSGATLRAVVRHGEYIHNEDYRLARRQTLWFVRQVVLDAGVVIH